MALLPSMRMPRRWRRHRLLIGATAVAVAARVFAGGASSRASLAEAGLNEPFLQGSPDGIRRWQALNAIAMAFNILMVSLPGRIDQEPAEDLSDGSSAASATRANADSLFAPAGWVFIIWLPIYVGEMAWNFFLQFRLGEDREAFEEHLINAACWFGVACFFQGLWCLTFRAVWRDSGKLWISTLSLGMAAAALGIVEQLLSECELPTRELKLAVQIPVQLHFAWLCAAALVNFNRQVAATPGALTAGFLTPVPAAIISDLIAAALACTLAIEREAPILAVVIALALAAVASQCSRRIREIDPYDVRLQPSQWDPADLSALQTPRRKVAEDLQSALRKLRLQHTASRVCSAVCGLTATGLLVRTAMAS
eukprot:TRINITY_DN11725_c0_g1_i1.p1 TRINITY_DN11725_c0_g1~~TRINITY_DN11725_c0_g1_i1.p1  ORF type:complete len:368 (+),score=59.19 TRINITY_DN11725_c0_g1_i1:248-1351(+)